LPARGLWTRLGSFVRVVSYFLLSTHSHLGGPEGTSLKVRIREAKGKEGTAGGTLQSSPSPHHGDSFPYPLLG
jgi:hypothetical protein